jgi:hypothetical protein
LKQQKRRGVIPISLGILILYFFLFPVVLQKELVIKPVWCRSINLYNFMYSTVKTEGAIPFRFKEIFGYLSPDGRISYFDYVLYNVTYTKNQFINYPRIMSNIIIQDNVGNFLTNTQVNGYPFFDQGSERLFVVKNDSTGLTEIMQDGLEKWKAEFTSIITSLDINKDSVLLGLSNGKLKLIDNSGNILYETIPEGPEGSKIPIIYGCAVSKQSDKLACISGLYPQWLFLLEGKAYENPNVHYFRLSTDFRREVFIQFSREENYLFFEDKEGLGFLELSSKKAETISFNGQFSGLSEIQTKDIINVLSKDKEDYCLHVYRLKETLLYQEKITSEYCFIINYEEYLLLGLKYKNTNMEDVYCLLRMDFEEL